MHALDTNVLVRALTRDDLQQSPAAVAFIAHKGPVWVSHIVLAETFWVLESVYGQEKPQLVEVLKRLLDGKDFALEGPQVVRAALAIYESKSKVDFDDFDVDSQDRDRWARG